MSSKSIIAQSLPIYLPSLLVQLGYSLSATFNPLWSAKLGADLAMVGLIASSVAIGSIAADLPLAFLSGKIREKPFLLLSMLGLAVASVLKSLATEPWHLFAAGFLSGMAISGWGILRVAYIRKTVAVELRGRTLSYMGGIMRIARIVSPGIGGTYYPSDRVQIPLYVPGGFGANWVYPAPDHDEKQPEGISYEAESFFSTQAYL
jgi:MFS family permease